MTAGQAIAAPAARGGRTWRNEPSALVGLLLLAPALVLLILFFLVPIARIIWVALADPTFSFDRFGISSPARPRGARC